MSTLTGIVEIDVITLLNLDDMSLNRYCQADMYASELCNSEHFWAQKIQRLGLPSVICQGCDTFKESYFYFRTFLNSHGYIVAIQPAEQFMVFNNIRDAYHYLIRTLMKFSTIKESGEPVTDLSIFPPLEQANALATVYRDIVSLKSIEIGLYFFKFGNAFSLGNADSALIILFNGDYISNPNYTRIPGTTTDIIIKPNLEQRLIYRFAVPDNVVVAVLGIAPDWHYNVIVFKQLDESTYNYLLNNARQENIYNRQAVYYIINIRTQTWVQYGYNSSNNNFQEIRLTI